MERATKIISIKDRQNISSEDKVFRKHQRISDKTNSKQRYTAGAVYFLSTADGKKFFPKNMVSLLEENGK
jgi:hypothetical protein